ncbi:anthranilate phosphoribosyltransferase [Nodularia spumigena CCY9414]|nr:anthranilate phosphoribosyltransferase [Nodularia spumigena CCY9414]
MGKSTVLALAVLALTVPTCTTAKALAISWVMTVPLAPVSTIISNFCWLLKVTSTIGVPPMRRLIGAINTCFSGVRNADLGEMGFTGGCCVDAGGVRV